MTDEDLWAPKSEPISYARQRDLFIDALIEKAARHPHVWDEIGELAVAILKDREAKSDG